MITGLRSLALAAGMLAGIGGSTADAAGQAELRIATVAPA